MRLKLTDLEGASNLEDLEEDTSDSHSDRETGREASEASLLSTRGKGASAVVASERADIGECKTHKRREPDTNTERSEGEAKGEGQKFFANFRRNVSNK